MSEQLQTPVLFVIFNRPETERRVFAEIRKARPKKLYVVADGPRPHQAGEAERCAEARAIIDEVDWDCEVIKNYSEVNLGCKIRVSSGLDWFFQNVEEGIVLEDDCLPHPSFFPYCEEMLARYRNDRRVSIISGVNLQFGRQRGEGSYYFSRMCHIWGWASWRRVWQNYDVKMATWPEFKQEDGINKIWRRWHTRRYWNKIFQRIYDNEINTWDYQLVYSIWKNDGLSVIPNVNLVSNIGFQAGGTHTQSYHKFADLPTYDLGAIKHPSVVAQDVVADEYYARNLTLFGRIWNRLKFLN